jgi:predicted dinucleotide-binding enzyme
MKIGILGTGMVGQTIGEKLVTLGHEVKLGSRQQGNEKALSWVQKVGAKGSAGTFAEAAAFGELVFNCALGTASLEALGQAGAGNLKGKILIDVAVPLDFSKGMPPSLFSGNTDSLGEAAQRLLPDTKVVKALNTVNCNVMVDPKRVGGGEHDIFVAGNDAAAKAEVAERLRTWFGWKSVIDLGDITAARATESYLPLWLRLWGALKTADFNVRVVR